MTYVFVYGTLKRGFGLHRAVMGEARLLGEAVTLDGFVMWGSRFPYVARCDGGHQVVGELYSVSDEMLAILDRVEGAPHHYRRERLMVSVNGYPAEAWFYVVDYVDGDGEGDDAVEPVNGVLTWTGEEHHDDEDEGDEDYADRAEWKSRL